MLGFGLLICVSGCRQESEPETRSSGSDIRLADYQERLLDIAFAAASAMPIQPHIKNRSRAQEVVVTTCLELDQPQRARRYIEQIDNWRRGAAYADLAFYYAQHGVMDQVEPYLEMAAQVPDDTEGWRKDRIEVKIAATRAYLRQDQAVEEPNVVASELGPLIRARAMACPPTAFDQQMAVLSRCTEAGNFEATVNVLAAYADLYHRFYAEPERRARIERTIKDTWKDVPVLVRVDLLMQLAQTVLTHSDQAKALELVDEAKTIMDDATWQAQFAIPPMAKLAALRFRSGDEAAALGQAQVALELFEAQRETIANIYRAQMLRPIAEAFHAMGDTVAALDLYKRAVEAGMENPNSRPRADDLVATCCSLALHAVEPDQVLMARIREIGTGLGDPW